MSYIYKGWSRKMSDKKRNAIFISLVVTVVISSMLTTALTTALPSIMADFHINAATGQWLTSVYSLVMGILVLVTPFMVRRFKTKPLYLISFCYSIRPFDVTGNIIDDDL